MFSLKELEIRLKSVLQANSRQCDMLLHCNEKKASEFALQAT